MPEPMSDEARFRSPSWIGNSWPDCPICSRAAQSGCANYPWTCANGHTLVNGFERLQPVQSEKRVDNA